MSRKKHKKNHPPAVDITEVDEQLLLDPNYFYWAFIRPAEDDAEKRKERRAERRAKQKAKLAASTVETASSDVAKVSEAPTEEVLTSTIERIIRTTHHAYGWQHLGELGQQLRQLYPDLKWSDYGCKKLLEFLQKYPALFKIKWSAPAHKGASHTWVRNAYEPKLKEGYSAK